MGAATGKMASKGFQVTGLFPCDKNIFRPHDFPLASEDISAAPVKHLALVKTSDQPSLSSANFLPFISAEDLQASDISVLSSLNLQRNTRGGTANKITSSPYRKFVVANQKKKIKHAIKSKTILLPSDALLGPLKRWKSWVCQDLTLPDTPLDSDTDLPVPFNDDLTEEEEQVTGNGRFSEDHNRAEWIQCTKYLRWDKNFVLVCRKILFVPLVRDKH